MWHFYPTFPLRACALRLPAATPSPREGAVGVTAPGRAWGGFGGPEVYTEVETVTLLHNGGMAGN